MTRAPESARLVGAYVRVSSKAQNLATQHDAVVRKATSRDDQIDHWYSEKRSGKDLGRPELERLRQDVREGKIRRLYLFRFDRLTRSGIRDTFNLIEEFRTNGCEVVSVADGFALDGPAGEVVLAVMAWAAKMERLATNERISAARERLEAEGRSWGRQPRLTSNDIQRAVAMREEGRTWRSISMALRIPKSTVHRAVMASQKVPRDSGQSKSENQDTQGGTFQ